MVQVIVAFAPDQQNTNRILRGSKDPESRSDELLLEWLNADSAYGFRATRRLLTQRTPYQMLEVFETPQWGRLFRLDGSYMSSEGDEFFYHEPIVHAAAIPHASPRSALVVGGGYRQYRGDDVGEGPGFTFEPAQRVSHRSNVFAQAQFDVGRAVFITAGTKLEHNEFTGAEPQPSLGVRWTRERQTFWASVSRAVRVPA